MSGDVRAFRAAEQLSAILATAPLPPAARALAERVEARLAAPVRIAVLGRPGAGKRRIVEGLIGGAVLPAIDGLPPAEIALGPGDRIDVTTGEGTRMRLDIAEFPALDPAELAFVRLSAPLPLLEKIRFLVVPLEGGPAEMRAALGWTVRRSDMLLWCMPRLDAPDRALWPFIPDAMRDHAYLCVTEAGPRRAAEADRWEAANCFSETRDLSGGAEGPERIARLRTALLAHVSRARREDLEGALIFLDHHLSQQGRDWPPLPPAHPGPAHPGPADPAAPAAPPAGALAPALPAADGVSGAPAGAPSDTPAAGEGREAAAGRIVDLLAARAGRLDPAGTGTGTGTGDRGAAARALELCAEALDDCAEIARAEGGALADLLDEASDLMVLLRLEGSESALADTVALMLQVRRECEAGLAA